MRALPWPFCSSHCPVFLSFFGIASIGLSCLVALFLYHVVFGIQYLGILNGVAAFVIVGIGEFSQLWHRTPASPKKVSWVVMKVVGTQLNFGRGVGGAKKHDGWGLNSGSVAKESGTGGTSDFVGRSWKLEWGQGAW